MKIREYTPADERGWLDCRVRSFLDTSYCADVKTEKEKYLKPELSLVAEDKGSIVGLIDIEIDSCDLTYTGEDRGCIIWNLAVLPGYRRKGVASALWNEAKKRLTAQGIRRCEVWTQEDDAANAFYRAKGFALSEEHTWLRCRANAAGVEKMVSEDARDGLFGIEELVFNAPLHRRDEFAPMCDHMDEVRLYTAQLEEEAAPVPEKRNRLIATIAAALVLLMCGGLFIWKACAPKEPLIPDIPVVFADPRLEAEVRRIHGFEGEITQRDLATVTYLSAFDCNITDLGGIEYCINIERLYLDDNKITDITPLAGLTKLKSLSLTNNDITDISPLAGLTGLIDLNISGNFVEDISPLAGLTNLNSFEASHCNISDISPLGNLTSLEYIRMSSNRIETLEPLSALPNLWLLDICGNKSVDFDSVAGLTHLRELEAGDCGLTDISGLSGLTNMGALLLQDNQITDLSPISGMTELTVLDICGNNVSDISPITGMTKLDRIQISSNNVSNISPVAGCTGLSCLWMEDNRIADISPLAGLTDLNELYACSNKISDLSPIAGLTDLRYLALAGNEITDISPLSGLTKLVYLSLQDNDIADASPIEGLVRLENDPFEY